MMTNPVPQVRKSDEVYHIEDFLKTCCSYKIMSFIFPLQITKSIATNEAENTT